MIIDEPLNDSLLEWIKKAIWQARNDNEKGIEIFSNMIAEHPALRREIATIMVRSVIRNMIWEQDPMG